MIHFRHACSVLFMLAVLLFLGWLSYGEVQGHQLLHWDDVTYVAANPFVQSVSMENLVHMLTGFTLGNWHPLTWASYLLNYLTGTADVTGLKFTNLVLHVLASLLAGVVAGRVVGLAMAGEAGVRRGVARCTSVLTAVLFCIHPQHVESVTWVAERKDVLCGLFYFAALAVYLRSGEREGGTGPSVVLFALLAMLSKPMAVSLPIVLVAADLFVLNRVRELKLNAVVKLFAEKWLILLCSAAVVVITLLGQSPQGLAEHGWADRLLISLQALGFYVRQFFLPLELVPFHPVSAYLPPQKPLLVLGTGVLMFPLIACLPAIPTVIRQALLAGFLYFFITLLPVLGIVKVGEQAFADRYAYIPTLPFYVLVSWILSGLLMSGMLARRAAIAVVVFSIAAGLIHKTRSVLPIWSNDETLWAHVVATYPEVSALAHLNLGNAFFTQKNYSQALEQYEIALSLDPDGLQAHYNRALVLEKLGRTQELGDVYSKMVRRNPDSPYAWAWFGEFALRNGRIMEAADLYGIALGIDPRTDIALFGLARIKLVAGDDVSANRLLGRIGPHSVYYPAAQKMIADQ